MKYHRLIPCWGQTSRRAERRPPTRCVRTLVASRRMYYSKGMKHDEVATSQHQRQQQQLQQQQHQPPPQQHSTYPSTPWRRFWLAGLDGFSRSVLGTESTATCKTSETDTSSFANFWMANSFALATCNAQEVKKKKKKKKK